MPILENEHAAVIAVSANPFHIHRGFSASLSAYRIDSNAKCNGLVEGNFGIDIELCQEGLDRGFEIEAFSWGEVMH